MNCTRCSGTGLLNVEHLPTEIADLDAHDALAWVLERHDDYPDVTACDCCGDGDRNWHGCPGEHDLNDLGKSGPYAYNGGLPECW